MSLIKIQNLSFSYPGAVQPLFNNVKLELDTKWRLGLVGRNGRGKTTFLKLLLGQLEYAGSIAASEPFEYFPLRVTTPKEPVLRVARGAIAPFDEWEAKMARLAARGTAEAMAEYAEVETAYSAADGYVIDESIAAEARRLGIMPEALERPFDSLSGGEQVKLLLAALFLKKHRFLLIDEPTDHLDAEGRRMVGRWLAGKSGFILVSHDRAFLDEAVDHVLSINRADIELQRGNYSSWRHNRAQQDAFEQAENRKLEASIRQLAEAARRTERWSDKTEKSKKAGNQTYNRGSAMLDRGYVGHQAARMMQRGKAIERRREGQIEQKRGLLKNVETTEPVRFLVLPGEKSKLLAAGNLGMCYAGRWLFRHLSFEVRVGERLALRGANGSGKSTLLKLLLGQFAPLEGNVWRAGGLQVSALPQNTDFLRGGLRPFAAAQGVDESLFFAILRKLDFEREAFERPMESFSAGQKKKVCLAASLARPAQLFIWDEPLNYVDVLSREQTEQAVLECTPTLIVVEHDAVFLQRVATGCIDL